jgi:hypothetical protein
MKLRKINLRTVSIELKALPAIHASVFPRVYEAFPSVEKIKLTDDGLSA